MDMDSVWMALYSGFSLILLLGILSFILEFGITILLLAITCIQLAARIVGFILKLILSIIIFPFEVIRKFIGK